MTNYIAHVSHVTQPKNEKSEIKQKLLRKMQHKQIYTPKTIQTEKRGTEKSKQYIAYHIISVTGV